MCQNNYKFAILMEESNLDINYTYWIKAIEDSDEHISYKVINFTESDWIEQLNQNYDMFLITAPFPSMRLKNLFDERLYILNFIMKKKIYPSFDAFYMYENKKLLSYYLKSLNIPHPQTFVFYNKQEALESLKKIDHPIVAKTFIGAAGLGVCFLKNTNDSKEYIVKAFGRGIRPKIGPDIRKPYLMKRIFHGIQKKGYLKQKIINYFRLTKDKQIGFVYFQEFIPHEFEWRCVRIDNSFFAHKKIVKEGMASGYLIKKYDNPPMSLLFFVKKISDSLKNDSAAFDIFEICKDEYLVNEVQAIFGQSDSYQMLVDGVPGRYVFENNNFIFQSGDFNRNKSFNLRLEHAVKILKSQKLK
jgi:glutathione synthase/RimK-type ligase-like ATP-grasp enzyme